MITDNKDVEFIAIACWVIALIMMGYAWLIKNHANVGYISALMFGAGVFALVMGTVVWRQKYKTAQEDIQS